MKNGSKEPNWSKFGLDGERQPLTQGSSSAEHAKVSKELGQVVNDNELFADDQVIFAELNGFRTFAVFPFDLKPFALEHLHLGHLPF